MPEPPYVPPFELWKTDHGTDGWDARTWLVAHFTTRERAIGYLEAKGYTYEQVDGFYHRDEARRHAMGAVSYQIRENRPLVPVDPDPEPEL